MSGVRVKLKKEKSELCAKIKVTEGIVVPPRNEMFIKASLEGSFPRFAEGVVEGREVFMRKSSLIVPRCLVGLSNGTLFVPLTNFSDKAIKVERATHIGSLEASVPLSVVSKSDEICRPDLALPDHLQPLVENVSPTVSGGMKENIGKLLAESSRN